MLAKLSDREDRRDDADVRGTSEPEGKRATLAQVALALCLVALAVNAVLIQTVLTDGGPLKNVVRAGVLGLALLGLVANRDRVPLWPLVWVGGAGALLLLRSNSDQLSIIFVVAIAMLAGQVSERFFFTWAALSSLLALALIFVLVAVGLSQDEVRLTDYDGVVRERHNFGAQSIPFLFNVVFGALALSVLYAKKYFTIVQQVVVVLASVATATYVYRASDTRGGYATFILFLVLLVVVPRVRLAKLYAAVPLILFGVTLWLASGDVDRRINRALSQRPDYYARFLGDIDFVDVLLGTSVKQFAYPVDSAYLHLLVGCSVAALVLFLWLYWRAVTTLMREERFAEVALLTASSVYCATEGLLVRIENGFIIVVWYLVLHYGAGLRDRGPQLIAGLSSRLTARATPSSDASLEHSEAQNRPSHRRRADIQGLRAVAVGLVIADHVLGWPAGGFVGVDVFFVISGFLITGLLLAEGETSGHLSIVDFYKRRARRILPAAVLVLSVTVVAASLVFSAERYETTRTDAVWALLFAENWHLASVGTDYFQATLPPSPVQHYWSLAVEEQFYVVWPIILIALLWGARRAANRRGGLHVRAWAGAFAALVMLGSFAWAVFQSSHEPAVAYFSTLTRAWELAAGALLAAAAPLLAHRMPTYVRNTLGGLGMVGLGFSALVITPDQPFPAPIGLLPVVSAVLVLASGIGATGRVAATSPLVTRPMTYIGGTSYSLYLWHWPIAVILASMMVEGPAYYLVVLGLTALASVLSYHLVEQPFQQPRRPHRRLAVIGVASLSIMVLTAMAFSPTRSTDLTAEQERQVLADQQSAMEGPADSAGTRLQPALRAAVESEEFPTLSPSLDDPKSDIAPEMGGDTGCLNPTSFDEDVCTYGPRDSTKTVVVVGDSVSTAWLPTIRSALPNWRVHGVALSNCPFPALDMDLDIAQEDSRCRDDYDDLINHVVKMRPDMVIASSAEYASTRLRSNAEPPEAIEEWREGVKRWKKQIQPSGAKLVILSPNPSGPDPSGCFTRFAKPSDCTQMAISSQWTDKREAESGVPGIQYVDTSGWFCWENKCPIFAAGTTIRWDLMHLTASYARLVAPELRAAILEGRRGDSSG